MGIVIKCDECYREIDDDIYCESCYDKLAMRIEELENENENLKDEIKALKEV